MARRSPWMDDRAQLLVRLLAERHDMVICEATAREDISNHVDHVAAIMGVGRRAAKPYVTDDVLSDMAERIAREVNRQRTRQALDPRGHLRVIRGDAGD